MMDGRIEMLFIDSYSCPCSFIHNHPYAFLHSTRYSTSQIERTNENDFIPTYHPRTIAYSLFVLRSLSFQVSFVLLFFNINTSNP
jgi:hypothetical protein